MKTDSLERYVKECLPSLKKEGKASAHIGKERTVNIISKRLFEGKTYRQIGEEVGITGSRIREIIAKSVRIANWHYEIANDKDSYHIRFCINKEHKILKTPIYVKDLNLTVRTYNCLLEENIKLVGDLLLKSDIELLNIPNLGKKGLREIQENLLCHDLLIRCDISAHNDKNNKKVRIIKGMINGLPALCKIDIMEFTRESLENKHENI